MARALVVLGPTAAGKSEVALGLARRQGGEIINADALQAYRGLAIGTAQPDPAARAAVPHHLYGLLDPRQAFSAGEFARLAGAAVREVEERGRVPVVVGGSGLYLHALLFGLADIPPVPPSIRAAWRHRLATEGLPVLRAELERRDPDSATHIRPGDPQRTLRALEVLEATGRPWSDWRRESPRPALPAAEARLLGVRWPRPRLRERIGRRIEAMLVAGWVDEVRGLLESGLGPESPGFQAIGYHELSRHLREGWPLGEAVEEIDRRTRQYAKRQETWFRRYPSVTWVDGTPGPDTVDSALQGGGGLIRRQGCEGR